MSFITFIKRKLDERDKRVEEEIALKQKIVEATKSIKEEEAIQTAIYKEQMKGKLEREAIKNGKHVGSGLMAGLNKINENVDFQKGMEGMVGKPKPMSKEPKIIF